MALPVRKHPRMDFYDYSQNGCYFITICAKDRKHLFGILPKTEDPPEVQLTQIGIIVSEVIQHIEPSYRNVFVDHAVVMPNHIHLLLRIDKPPGEATGKAPTVTTIVHALKRIVTKRVGFSVWQDSFYEHAVRNKDDYQMIWNYIEGNPSKWAEDKYFSL